MRIECHSPDWWRSNITVSKGTLMNVKFYCRGRLANCTRQSAGGAATHHVLRSAATVGTRQRFTLAAKLKAGAERLKLVWGEVNSECFLVQLRNKQQIVLKAAAQ